MAFLLVAVESVWQLCFSILRSTASLQLSLEGLGQTMEWAGRKQAPGGIQARPTAESRITVEAQPGWHRIPSLSPGELGLLWAGQARPAAASVLFLFVFPSPRELISEIRHYVVPGPSRHIVLQASFNIP